MPITASCGIRARCALIVEKMAAPKPAYLQWIQASIGQDLRMIPVEDILFFRSDEKYTCVQTERFEALIRKPVRDLAEELHGTKTVPTDERRRRSLRVCRQLQLLRAHGLIAKIPHSNRYKVTDQGDALMWSAVFLRVDRFPKALNAVA